MPLTSLPTSLLARSFTIAIAALALAPPAFAFPDKPLTLIVPYPPGGATDVVGRILAKALGAKLGQTVIVDNKAGAGTAIGAAALAQAAPDGHTPSKVIAVMAGKRVPLLPNAPTMVEAGYPSVAVEPWGALVAPGGLKPEVKKQLAKALADVLADADIKDQIEKTGFSVAHEPPAAYDARLAKELPALRALVHKAGITAQ